MTGLIIALALSACSDKKGDEAETDGVDAAVVDKDVPDAGGSEDAQAKDTVTKDAASPDTAKPDTSGKDVPEDDVPDKDVPDKDVPDKDVPDKDVPDKDVPDEDVPDEDVPDEDVPDKDVPDEDVPDEDVPDEDVPDKDVPDEDVPDTEISNPDIPTLDVPIPPGDAQDPPPELPKSDEQQTLDFLNHPTTTLGVLVGDVVLKGQTPNAILTFRSGADGLLGTDDDQQLESIEALDALQFVGKKSIDRLIAFARNWQPEIADPLLLALNSPTLENALLKDVVGLSQKAADNIMAYLSDQLFHARADVNAVAFVGDASIVKLEKHVNLGHLELLSSTTNSNLSALAFNDIGEALLVGSPAGGGGHVLWYTPFGEDAFTEEEDPYSFLDLSDGLPEAMTGISFDAKFTSAVVVGEAPGFYIFDAFVQELTFVPIDGFPSFSTVAFAVSNTEVYLASAESSTMYKYDLLTQQGGVYADYAANALYVPSDNLFDVMAVGDAGAIGGFNADGLSKFDLPGKEDLFGIFDDGGGPSVVGDYGAVVQLGLKTGARLPTRRLSTLRSAALSPDGTYVLMVGHDGLVMRHSMKTGTVGPIQCPIKVDLAAVAFSDDGTALIVGDKGVVLQYLPKEAE